MVLLISSAFLPCGWAWSNGGYSADPPNPDYGTHDWIAQHALDWLPAEEKQYILNNLPAYLYGTELPDNGGAPDGIGDTTLHHIYYSSAGAITDDAAAVRASTEYQDTLNFLKSRDLLAGAKNAGVMSHYIADMAVFGHVMGSSTNWGAETHHSDYETYVNDRTSIYNAEFNTYLSFDGILNTISAYDAAKNLAYDTTFDIDGDLTCVWMDQNYNWNNPTFKNRAGESLNLAVNYLADVLHTLSQEPSLDIVPPTTIDNYDDLWHKTDITITLTATDTKSGVAETYYKINNGPTKTVSADGQPIITESAVNTLEYWSKDNANNEENHHALAGIKLDRAPPAVTITDPSQNAETKSSTITITWTGSDGTSGINNYEIRLDNGLWNSVQTSTTHALTGLADGSHKVDVKAIDKAGNEKYSTVTFTVNTSQPFGLGPIVAVIIVAIVAAAILGTAAYIIKKRRKN